LPWTFRVVDDPAVNAFAIPGGFVYVTRGILSHMTNEAQLATVMGHEIGHVTARHTAHQMSREQVANLGLAVGSIASSRIARYAGLASQALGVLFLKFSRDNENQADELGVRYSSRANYDSRQMDSVMAMLDRIESTLAQGANADQAARAFLSQQGLRAGTVTRGNVNGLSTAEAPFAATSQNGTLQGQAVFVEYGRNVYQLLAYAPEASWATNRG